MRHVRNVVLFDNLVVLEMSTWAAGMGMWLTATPVFASSVTGGALPNRESKWNLRAQVDTPRDILSTKRNGFAGKPAKANPGFLRLRFRLQVGGKGGANISAGTCSEVVAKLRRSARRKSKGRNKLRRLLRT
jgi:hypothetical protein